MHEMPAVADISVIVPHFNSPALLHRLLNSIPRTSGRIQVIVVDDHSADVDRLSEVRGKHMGVEFYSNRAEVKGAGAARNFGLEKATGTWVLFADADDFFVPAAYDTLRRYIDAPSDIVFFTPTSAYDGGETSAERHLAYERLVARYMETGDPTLRYRFFPPWSKLFRRSFLEAHGVRFDETIVSNDVMFSTRAGHYAAEIAAAKEVIYCVTCDGGSLTSNVSEAAFDARYDVAKRYNEFLLSVGAPVRPISMARYLMGACRFGPRKIAHIYEDVRQSGLSLFPNGYRSYLFSWDFVAIRASHLKQWLNLRFGASNRARRRERGGA
jgi:glycosyltransferase involved in cell wall biosynthesis